MGEFESDQKRFLLSLRTVFAQGIAADAEYQIVAVDARSGESVDEILFPGLEQQLFERGVVQLRAVFERHLFAVAGEVAVVSGDFGFEQSCDFAAFAVDDASLFDQLTVVYAEHLFVPRDFEQAVAFAQYGVVAYQSLQISTVQLGDKTVQVAAAFVGGIADEHRVGRGDDHHRDQSHVVRESFVLLAVALEGFASFAGEGAHDALAAAFVGEVLAVEQEEVAAVAHVLPVGHRQRRLAHRKEIDRVDHVGFARSVVAHEAVDAGPEFEILFPDVLEIDERQFFQVHECVFSSMPV